MSVGLMWEAFVWFHLLVLARPLGAEEWRAPGAGAAITPRHCSLECIRQGGPGCEYCRITRADVEKTLGFHSMEAFGSCIPYPCFELLGEDKCKHFVQAPNDVTVEFTSDQNPESDTAIVSWKPSHYGIAFLRGFQVSLQLLGGSHTACQLLLLHSNSSLTPSHAHQVYTSDPFTGLALGAQYAVTVMALPVPEKWDKFSHSKIFSTRSCSEKNSFDRCKKDWYPKYIEVQQKGSHVIVTFNVAPPSLGITSYFSWCYGGGMKTYMDIQPNSTKNRTHHSYHLDGLKEGSNYTCEIAADEVDAVRKTFTVQVLRVHQEVAPPLSASPPLTLMLPLGLAFIVVFLVLLVAIRRWRSKLRMKKMDIKPDILEQHQDECALEEVTLLPRGRSTPPRLLICYSRRDGPAHIRAVMQLGAFLQQHMATHVCLDLWDSLRLAEEGIMGWHCRRIQESDFVLVICSRGLRQGPVPSHLDHDDDEEKDEEEEEEEEEEETERELDCAAAVALIGEEVGRAKARGRDLSKYMAAIFNHSEETDIPAELGLVSRYTLTRDLPLLFSHLHGVALHRPGGYLKIQHVSEEGMAKVPAGAALERAVSEAERELREKEKRCVGWDGVK